VCDVVDVQRGVDGTVQSLDQLLKLDIKKELFQGRICNWLTKKKIEQNDLEVPKTE
jgi:hypothetical protein